MENASQSVNLRIFPNPITSTVFIESASDNPIQSIELYNMLGQLIRRDEAINASEFSFDRNEIPSGFYLMNVRMKNREVTQKLMFK